MKWVVGILIACVVALGVWLSLTVGRIEPVVRDTTTDTPTSTPLMTYTDTSGKFRISYPEGYTPEQYVYQALGPGRTISGTRLLIAPAFASGTNLSEDSYISVEPLPGAINSCSASIYLAEGSTHEGFVDVAGHRYSVSTSMGAAAGNRYEERVYATPVDGGCLAVRYFVHYGAIENYPKGAVQNFDRQALLRQFDTIRESLEIL